MAVVMVSFNTASLTTKALQTVFASEDVKLNVYLVDNHSSDRTLSTLRRRFQAAPDAKALAAFQESSARQDRGRLFPGVIKDSQTINSIETAAVGEHWLAVLLAEDNLGFGRANNLAAAWSQDDYVLFLNSDTEVKPRTIYQMVQQFLRVREQQVVSSAVLARWQRRLDNLGILAAMLINPDGSVQRQGGALPSLNNVLRWISFADDLPGMGRLLASYQHQESDLRSIARRTLTKVGWVGGTAMMVRRECLAEIGGFDPQIFMYGEDVDLCWRASRRHWDVAITSAAEVIHLGSASSSKRNAILGEINGLVYLWQKHYSLGELRMLRLVLRLGLHWRILIFGILHRYGQQRIYREALELV